MLKSLALLLLLGVCVWGLQLTQVAERVPYPGRWVSSDANPEDLVSFKILLKQRNLDRLNTLFWEVSDPSHANYGKFLTQNELTALIAPEKTSFKAVLNWLLSEGVSKTNIASFASHIQVVTTVKQAAALFHTEFATYTSSKTGRIRTRIVGAAHIPTSLMEHVDFVAGISELIDDTRIAPKVAEKPHDDDVVITPSILQAYYQIPAGSNATNPKTTQAIAAFSDYYSAGALVEFDQYFNIAPVTIQASGPDCLSANCDQYESDLDVQYVTAMGLGVTTEFLAHGDGEWILDWALALSNRADAPLVNSISYGWAELEQCEITSGCSTYGYTSQQYVTRTDTELQALGVKGLTIFVSDGDDGAPSLGGATGNCPIDSRHYCPTGGCQHTTSECAGLTFTLQSNDTVCVFPMGVGSDNCAVVLNEPNLNDALNAWAEDNSDCQIGIEYDTRKNPHVYSSCTCDKLKVKASSGISIAPYTFDQNNGAVFAADYPTSSPYVTSVGATQFTWSGNTVASEIGASILTGAIITTGGGFSSFQAQPSYQSAAVAAYLSSGVALPPSFSYNPQMRAYPDIAFNGHHYQIFFSNNTDQDTCPCASMPVDGTSCSSPALAGLISLINDKLINAGKSPLGFLNPILYKIASADPSAFTDITSGSNQCNRAYCCEYGYTATTGWDPVSGLGSPVFPKLEAYFLSAKGVN
jgi:subtilase family serine protease